MLKEYLKFFSEFKSLCNYKWYILNKSKVIYLIIFNEIVFIKYHIGFSDIDQLLLYELDKEDFKLFKHELGKKKNTVNIRVDSETKQLYLCDKTRLIGNFQYDELKNTNLQLSNLNYTNINPLFIKSIYTDELFDSIDLGNFKAYQVDSSHLVNDIYINKIFNVVKLDEVVWSINKDDAVLKISNLDNDLNIYLKLIVKYE